MKKRSATEMANGSPMEGEPMVRKVSVYGLL
jgi:hypothetical protein